MSKQLVPARRAMAHNRQHSEFSLGPVQLMRQGLSKNRFNEAVCPVVFLLLPRRAQSS